VWDSGTQGQKLFFHLSSETSVREGTKETLFLFGLSKGEFENEA
jgi:hypothetical protein